MFTGVSEPKSWDGQEFIDQLKSVKANIMTRSLFMVDSANARFPSFPLRNLNPDHPENII